MIPATASVRLAKQTSNLFRARVKTDAPGLDTSGLRGVISIDPDAAPRVLDFAVPVLDIADLTLHSIDVGGDYVATAAAY